MKTPTNNEYIFDTSTRNVGEVCDILDAYPGQDWCDDVFCQFDWWGEATTKAVDGVDAFVFLDEDGDLMRLYWSEGNGCWCSDFDSNCNEEE